MLTNSVEMREEGSLDQFDQQEFFENRAEDVSMDSAGYIYIPERCAPGKLFLTLVGVSPAPVTCICTSMAVEWEGEM